MLIPFWIKTNVGLGYGVTASSEQQAFELLRQYGYPRSDEIVSSVQAGVKFDALDQGHVVPNAGPMVVRGIWFPRHNV